MKKLSYIIMFLAAFILAIMSACGTKPAGNGGSNGGNGGGNAVIEEKVDITINDPDHFYTVKENDSYLIKNCETDYVIVTPENIQVYEGKGLSLLLKTFKQATGIDFTVKTESEVEDYSATAKYISLGNTKLVEQAGIDTRYAELKDKGVRIVSKDSSVFILGKTARGVYNSVLKFVKYVLGYERYTENCVVCKENLINLHFFEFDAFDNPDIEYVTMMYHVPSNETYAEEIGLENSTSDYYIGDVPMAHNTFGFLNPDTYYSEHPCWYNSEVTQLCYTAWGDPTEYSAMLDTVADIFVECIKNNPDAKAISFTHEDGFGFCQCEHCLALKTTYGTEAACVIRFMNDLRDVFDAKLAAESIDREIKLAFFAYTNTEKAPVKKNDSGEIVPIDETVVCKKGVLPMVTLVHADYTKEVEDPKNAEYDRLFKEWSVISDEFTAYAYSDRCTQVESYMMPYGNFDTLQSWNKKFAEINTQCLFYEAQDSQPNPSIMAHYKIYLMAKLGWDSDADVGKITEDFFNNVYLDAAEPMKRYFNDLVLRMHVNYDVLNMYAIVYSGPNLLSEEYWPKNTLEKWMDIFSEAYAAVEKYKESDPELYSVLYDRICLESLSPRMMYISIYQNSLAPETLTNMMREFAKDATRLNTRKNQMAWEGW
ncbi:MAG: DUF4838 domain-containing protein [Clostridia bacterium]|nr:DUF4838 domain-containing protein [Clostridia bacterium]